MKQERSEAQILAACHAVCQLVDDRQDTEVPDDTKRIIQDSILTYLNLCSMKSGGFEFYVFRPSTRTLEHVPHLVDRVSVLTTATSDPLAVEGTRPERGAEGGATG